jgi:hypothetical protein
MNSDNQNNNNHEHDDGLVELKLKIPKDLYRAYQRCTWIIIHETGREQLDIMEEMVLDFLVKNEC